MKWVPKMAKAYEMGLADGVAGRDPDINRTDFIACYKDGWKHGRILYEYEVKPREARCTPSKL